MMAEADEAARDAGSATPAVAPASDRRPRLVVPLILAAGWGALFSYSLTYLMEDTPRDGGRQERGIPAEVAALDLPNDVFRPVGVGATRARWRDGGPETTAATDAGARVVPASLSQETGATGAGRLRPEPLPASRPETAAPDGLRPDTSRPDTSRPDTSRPNSTLQDPARQESTPRDAIRAETPRLDGSRMATPRGDAPRRATPRTEYAGIWGPTAVACGARSRRRGYLPATITDDGARAGRTQCRFRNGRREGAAWVVAADCTERGHSWTSQVRLLVEGDRLTWTSAKGTSAYVRCGRRDG